MFTILYKIIDIICFYLEQKLHLFFEKVSLTLQLFK